jgi:hypothetical protein
MKEIFMAFFMSSNVKIDNFMVGWATLSCAKHLYADADR